MRADLAEASAVTSSGAAQALERSRGEARIVFERLPLRGATERTQVRELYQSGSAKARSMRLDNAGFQEVVLINTSGGLTDGDRLISDVRWAEGARGIVTTQAAERVYRSRAGAAELRATLHVEGGARAVWAPQETIVFDGGRFRRRTEIHLDGGSEIIACEALIYGRAAMGEALHAGAIDDGWRVRMDGQLVYADTLKLEGDIAHTLARPALGAGAAASATLLYAGARAAEMRDRARAALAAVSASSWGVTARRGVTVVRVLAHANLALRAALETALEALLAAFTPAGPALPRSWRL